ncbi:hypothetical protein DBV15_03709 [Temnothorax longispinosus]|uniref:Uncharacterized protein n=1 Tax=Temnothorax longispinosus TaxID=300112 RepID=A0A4S2KE83_9HYME|nr:hypothetical protein DBV15_03709 [Temnothorax longispinosus]
MADHTDPGIEKTVGLTVNVLLCGRTLELGRPAVVGYRALRGETGRFASLIRAPIKRENLSCPQVGGHSPRESAEGPRVELAQEGCDRTGIGTKLSASRGNQPCRGVLVYITMYDRGEARREPMVKGRPMMVCAVACKNRKGNPGTRPTAYYHRTSECAALSEDWNAESINRDREMGRLIAGRISRTLCEFFTPANRYVVLRRDPYMRGPSAVDPQQETMLPRGCTDYAAAERGRGRRKGAPESYSLSSEFLRFGDNHTRERRLRRGTKDYRRGSVTRRAGRTYQVARTLSRLDRVEGGLDIQPLLRRAGNESAAPLSSLLLLLLFHSNQLEKRRTLSLSPRSWDPWSTGLDLSRANGTDPRSDPAKVSCIVWPQKKSAYSYTDRYSQGIVLNGLTDKPFPRRDATRASLIPCWRGERCSHQQYEKMKILGSRVGNGRANNIFYAQIDRLDIDHASLRSQCSPTEDKGLSRYAVKRKKERDALSLCFADDFTRVGHLRAISRTMVGLSRLRERQYRNLISRQGFAPSTVKRKRKKRKEREEEEIKTGRGWIFSTGCLLLRIAFVFPLLQTAGPGDSSFDQTLVGVPADRPKSIAPSPPPIAICAPANTHRHVRGNNGLTRIRCGAAWRKTRVGNVIMAERDVRARKAVTAIIGDCPRRMGATMAGSLYNARTSYINIALAALPSSFSIPLPPYLPPALFTLGYLPLRIQPLNKPTGLYEDITLICCRDLFSPRATGSAASKRYNCRRPNNLYRVLINAALYIEG